MTASPPAALLAVRGLSAGYGVMEVVHDVDLDVAGGELVCVVGRNGAGKTTLVKAIAGMREGRTKGSVLLRGSEVVSASATEIVRRGLVLVPEGHRVFKEMSVHDNLRLGGYLRRRQRTEIDEAVARVCELFPVLATYRDKATGNLSGGEQQMVAVGQALVAKPQVLVLDEPSSGLALGVVSAIYEVLNKLRNEGMAVVVVEQNVDRALKMSDRCYVLEGGQVAIQGDSAQLAQDPRVAAIVTGVTQANPV